MQPGTRGFFRIGPAALMLAALVAAIYLARVSALAPDRFRFEALFVASKIINATAALFLSGALGRQVGAFFDMMASGSGEPALDRIFNLRGNTILAALVLTIIVLSAWAVGPWSATGQDHRGLRVPLLMLLALANVPTGLAFGALVHFWWEAYRVWSGEKLAAFPLPRAKIARYTMINTTVAVTVAVIACSTLLGLRVSVLRPDQPLILFSLLTLLVVGAVYLVPLFSLSTRLGLAREDRLGEIEKALSTDLETLRGADLADTPARTAKLLRYRDLLLRIRTFPPNGGYPVIAMICVVILALLPALIDFIVPQGH